MPPPRRQLQLRRTVLVVVEGDTEFAFCRYLKAIGSHGRNLQVTIKNAHGGSPDRIVEFARRQARQSAFDQVVILMDDDRPLSPSGHRTVRSMRARLFSFSPCVEGFYLRLLRHPVPATSDACKRAFHAQGLNEQQKVDHDAYARLFPQARLADFMSDADFAALWKLFTHDSP